jgi:hypothetical protein
MRKNQTPPIESPNIARLSSTPSSGTWHPGTTLRFLFFVSAAFWLVVAIGVWAYFRFA